jgi:phosphopantothenoylcysteine decarboxylase/phosphopantothenate--cysteine ligase
MRVLVTAGPTREHWDRVRFLTSAATGRLGIVLAEALAARGHGCELVLGPTHLGEPNDDLIAVHRAVSARDLLAACERVWPECDAIVATAAVADYRPAAPVAGKRTKTAGPVSLELVRNPDILATLAQGRGRRPAIGFALQVEDAEDHARRKLAEKDLDAIVLDGPEAMGAGTADFRILRRDGGWTDLPGLDKAALAERLVDLLEELDAANRSG